MLRALPASESHAAMQQDTAVRSMQNETFVSRGVGRLSERPPHAMTLGQPTVTHVSIMAVNVSTTPF